MHYHCRAARARAGLFAESVEAGQELVPGRRHGLASFETRPLVLRSRRRRRLEGGAPQDEDKPLMALRKFLILRRPRKRSSRRTHGARSSRLGFLAQPLRFSALRLLFSQGRRRIFTSVRLQSPSPQPGGSSRAISNSLLVEPGFVAKTANTWPEQAGSVVKLAIV